MYLGRPQILVNKIYYTSYLNHCPLFADSMSWRAISMDFFSASKRVDAFGLYAIRILQFLLRFHKSLGSSSSSGQPTLFKESRQKLRKRLRRRRRRLSLTPTTMPPWRSSCVVACAYYCVLWARVATPKQAEATQNSGLPKCWILIFHNTVICLTCEFFGIDGQL